MSQITGVHQQLKRLCTIFAANVRLVVIDLLEESVKYKSTQADKRVNHTTIAGPAPAYPVTKEQYSPYLGRTFNI